MMLVSKILLKNSNLNKFLLVLRDNKKDIPYPNYWSLLGGGIEKGESPEQALKRELIEEIGIEINKVNLIKEMQLDMEFNNKKISTLLFLFKADIDLEIDKIKLNEGQRLEYFSQDEILKLNNVGLWIKEFIINHKDLLE